MFRNCGCSSNTNQDSNPTDELDLTNEIYQDSCNIEENTFDETSSCSCGFDNTSAFTTNYMYGHCYVPRQKMNKVYTPDMGLKMGTIFPELVSPYCPNQSLETINYLKNSNQIGGGCNS